MSESILPPSPGSITICGIVQANRHKRRYDAVLTLEDPRARPGHRLRFTRHPSPPHLVLAFEDVDTTIGGFAVMTRPQMERVVAFGRDHAERSMLVHCHHGVGRSAACALALLVDRSGPGQEGTAVAELFSLRPEATPNLVAVALADDVLGRGGALVSALSDHEARDPTMADRREMRREFLKQNSHLYAMAAPTMRPWTGARDPHDDPGPTPDRTAYRGR